MDMRKEYEKPEVNMVSLITEENITEDIIEGSMGVGDSPF